MIVTVYRVDEGFLAGKQIKLVSVKAEKKTKTYVFTEKTGITFGCARRCNVDDVDETAEAAIRRFIGQKHKDQEALAKKLYRIKDQISRAEYLLTQSMVQGETDKTEEQP